MPTTGASVKSPRDRPSKRGRTAAVHWLPSVVGGRLTGIAVAARRVVYDEPVAVEVAPMSIAIEDTEASAIVSGAMRPPRSATPPGAAVLVLRGSPGFDDRGAFCAQALQRAAIASLEINHVRGNGTQASHVATSSKSSGSGPTLQDSQASTPVNWRARRRPWRKSGRAEESVDRLTAAVWKEALDDTDSCEHFVAAETEDVRPDFALTIDSTARSGGDVRFGSAPASNRPARAA